MNQRFIAGSVLITREGISGLLQIKTSPGKPSKLPPDVLEKLRQRLQERTGFDSYGEIQHWLQQKYDVQAAYATVHGIVRYKRSVETQSTTSSQH